MKETYLKEKVVLTEETSVHLCIGFTAINFSSYRSNIFRLNKIYESLQGRFDNDKLLIHVSDNKDKTKYDASWCGCYVIYLKNSLYYYIGYSSAIAKRLSSHVSVVKKVGSEIFLHTLRKRVSPDLHWRSATTSIVSESKDHITLEERRNKKTPLDFYIESSVENLHEFDIDMGPICLYKNYLKKFISKYPDYKLSVGEYLILTYYTDLIGKIMEQSLI